MTTLTVRAFQVPKAGSTPAECEDAYACNAGAGLCAVADGATDSAFQALWARVLTQGFVRQPPESWSEEGIALWLHEWLPAMQDEWHAAIDWPALPWHGLNKATQTGALATFLGVYLPGNGAPWHALAVGDCNLLRVDAAGRIVDCAPWCSAADFTSHPTALSSLRRAPGAVAATLRRLHLMSGALAQGDRLLLATDSLAACLLGSGAEGNGAVHPAAHPAALASLLALLDARTPNTEHDSLNAEHWTLDTDSKPAATDFAAWVEEQRRTRRMKNDDVTLLVAAEAGPARPARQRVEERRKPAPARPAGTTHPARRRRAHKRR